MSSSSVTSDQKSLWNRLVRVYNVDPQKYQRKGYGKYMSFLFIVCYFTLLPMLYTHILPYILSILPPKVIPGVGVVSINIGILILYNCVMYFIYKGKYPFFEKYRVNQKLWPWEQDYQKWIKLCKQSVKSIFVNGILLGLPMAVVDSLGSDYKVQMDQIPTTITMLWQVAVFIIVEDFAFYIGHSTLHKPQFYWIHKKHHQYHTTVSIAAQHCHPIQSFFSNSIPAFLGFKLLSLIYPVHVISIWVFFTFRIVETCDGHSGYEWSWANSELLPFSAGSAYHNFHHSHNVGNFGSFFKFWDTLYNTNSQYVKFREDLYNKEHKDKLQ